MTTCPRVQPLASRLRICALALIAGIAINCSTPVLGLSSPTACTALSKIALTEIGLSPKTLAATGASASQTTAIIAAVRSACESDVDGFSAAQADYSAALSVIRTLEPKVVDGSISQYESTLLADARQQLSHADSIRQNTFANIRAVVAATLDDDQEALLASVQSGSDVDVPVQYKAIPRVCAEWIEVSAELTLEGTGQAVSGPADAPEVAVVEALLEANLEAVTDAWNTLLNP